MVGLGAGGARYWLGRPFDRKTHDYELIAAPHDIELVPGHVTPAWTFGGQAPGVELRCRQGDELRVQSKSRDDLQSVISLLKGSDLDLDLQFINYR